MILLAIAALATQTEPLYVLSGYRSLPPGEQVLAQTLQGITGTDRPRIWLGNSGIGDEVLGEMRRSGTVTVDDTTVWALVDRFRDRIKDVIEYKLGTPSLNVATSLCGPKSGVAIDESMVDLASAHGLDVTVDVRNMDEQQAYASYRRLWRKGIVVEQSVSKPNALRDFAVRHRAFVMDTRDSGFRQQVVRDMGPDALVFGWGPDEYGWISDISSAQATGVAADWCMNLSVLETGPGPRLKPPVQSPVPPSAQGRYVAFVLSDGDNVQWQTGAFATDPKWYANPHRGEFPMTWEVSPLLARYAPAVLDEIYSRATPNDDFVTGAGLPGYVYPHLVPDRNSLAKQSAEFLSRSHLRIGSFLNTNDGSPQEVFPWLDLPEMDGAIYKDYSPYNRRQGELVWHDGKPCMAYRFVLWDGLMGVDDLVKAIEAMPSDPHVPSSYALVNVHAWSFDRIGGPIEAVRQVVQKLSPETRVVTATQLFGLLRANKVGQ